MIAYTGIILEEISAHQDPSDPQLQKWASALLRTYADEFKSAREYTEERAA